MFILIAGSRAGDADVLERMASELRGAAGAPRIWRDRDGRCAVASLRSDFTPEDAFDTQPIVSDRDDDKVLVFQGRIDNRDDLLQQLGFAAGERIADSALFAAAYARWGEECVHHVVGDFAFAAWHRDDGRIVAAVDHLGTRRLFWTRIGDGVALSAQLPPLLAHPDVSREPDLRSIASLLDAGIDRTSTPFTAIRALPGGQRAMWRDGDMRTERWWNPDWQPAVWYRDEREYVDEVRELFTRAVAAQLRGSSPISTTLSGGLDSGCVTAMAARLLASRGERLTAYTAVPEAGLRPSVRPNWEADDRQYAGQVATAYDNIDHHLVAPGGRCALEVMAPIHARSRTPAKATTNLLWFDAMATLALANGSRVMLTGQNGNAIFSWRGGLAVWELATHRRFRAALRQAASEARARRTNIARVIAGEMLQRARMLSRRTAGDEVHLPGLEFLNAPSALRSRWNEYAEVAGSRRFWFTFATTPRHVWWPDPVVQWGIEWRDPTADRRLIERVLQYPQAAFRAGGRERGLAREVAAGLLPDRVRLRRTQGAQVPEVPSLIAAHAHHYRAALDRMRASTWCRELFDFGALQRSLDGFANGSLDYYLAVTFDRALDIGSFLARLERDPSFRD